MRTLRGVASTRHSPSSDHVTKEREQRSWTSLRSAQCTASIMRHRKNENEHVAGGAIGAKRRQFAHICLTLPHDGAAFERDP
jgi:hypothetical protein